MSGGGESKSDQGPSQNRKEGCYPPILEAAKPAGHLMWYRGQSPERYQEAEPCPCQERCRVETAPVGSCV
jgi:hypothetical protein